MRGISEDAAFFQLVMMAEDEDLLSLEGGKAQKEIRHLEKGFEIFLKAFEVLLRKDGLFLDEFPL